MTEQFPDDAAFQLTISPNTLAEAEQLAVQRGTTVNELIVIAVECHLVEAKLNALRARVGGQQ